MVIQRQIRLVLLKISPEMVFLILNKDGLKNEQKKEEKLLQSTNFP